MAIEGGTSSSELTLQTGDVEVGAVELKDAAADVRAKVAALNTLAVGDIGLPVTDPVNNVTLASILAVLGGTLLVDTELSAAGPLATQATLASILTALTGTLTVDSELAAALAAADTMAKPTTAPTLAWQVGYNGATGNLVRVPTVYKFIATVAYTAATPQTIWTPTAGKKFRLMGWMLGNSVNGFYKFIDGSGGSEVLRTPPQGTNAPVASPGNFGNGILSAAADNVLQLDVSASGNVTGFVFGTEE